MLFLNLFFFSAFFFRDTDSSNQTHLVLTTPSIPVDEAVKTYFLSHLVEAGTSENGIVHEKSVLSVPLKTESLMLM